MPSWLGLIRASSSEVFWFLLDNLRSFRVVPEAGKSGIFDLPAVVRLSRGWKSQPAALASPATIGQQVILDRPTLSSSQSQSMNYEALKLNDWVPVTQRKLSYHKSGRNPNVWCVYTYICKHIYIYISWYINYL